MDFLFFFLVAMYCTVLYCTVLLQDTEVDLFASQEAVLGEQQLKSIKIYGTIMSRLIVKNLQVSQHCFSPKLPCYVTRGYHHDVPDPSIVTLNITLFAFSSVLPGQSRSERNGSGQSSRSMAK